MAGGWNPDHYLHFSDERTRPAIDLCSRIEIASPRLVVDLGCGPGNSTAVLRQRWPDARITGIDSSSEMIEAARAAYPEGDWILDDVATWTPVHSFDVVFSNATLQWVPDHAPLVERLFSYVAADGALAFQIPAETYAHVRTLIHEIATERTWSARMARPLTILTMEPPAFYYDRLAPLARSVDVWQTEYMHVMDSQAAIVDWISSTGLRPFLRALDTEDERARFLELLRKRVAESYDVRPDGKVLLPFKRIFVIAYK